MLFDRFLDHPAVKRAVAAGEEQAGKAVGRVLSSPAVAAGLQGLLSAASTARATVDAGVQAALKAANLPSAGDVQALKRKLEELEAVIDGLSARLEAERPPADGAAAEAPGEPPGEAPGEAP
jgi:hypothetical protein